MSAAKVNYYKARVDVNLPYQGGYVHLAAGEIVPASSPLLKTLSKAGLAEHFREVTPGGGERDGFGQWDVEQATAAPGEKRGAK